MTRLPRVLLALLPAVLLLAPAPSAAQTVINFDDISAPCTLAAAPALTTQYLSQGVAFGPASNGMKVVDHCSNFGFYGYSAPNFLAWSVYQTGSQETLSFYPPVDNFSIEVASSSWGAVFASAYDAYGTLLDYNYIYPSSTFQPISLSAVGIYSVVLETQGDSGAFDNLAYMQGIVTEVIADAGGPYVGDEGSAISLDGSGSSTTATSIVNYQWDCTNDGVIDASSPWPTGNTCTYADEGNYALRVVVTDSDGNTDVATSPVTIYNVAPTITSVSMPDGDEGVSVTMSATATDPGADTLTYAWNFGDTVVAYGPTVTHVYQEDGTYTVTVIVMDGDGAYPNHFETVVIANVAPAITSATIPSSGVEGSPLSFSGSATDIWADPITYSWDFGDSSSGAGDSVTHTYADDGVYSVTLTATDDEGGASTASGAVTVDNVAPVITSTSIPSSGTEGSLVTLSATATDVGADTLTYSWDFGDSSSGSGSSVSHAWADDGTYAVTLTVTDGDGGSDSAGGSITLANAAPVISSTSYGSGDEGSAVAFSVVFIDPGAADSHVVSWDFGDSTSTMGSSVTHTYADDGSYPVAVTVTDDEGAFDVDVGTSSIANVAPTITSVTAPGGTEGVPITMSATATDPGADTLTYSWDFGDSGTGTGASVSHTYADQGTWSVVVTTTDGDGGTDSQTATVVVVNAPPVITSTSIPATGTEGASVALSAAATDVATDTLTWSWDFGDSATGSGASVSHSWAENGTYTVAVTVSDGDSGTATDTGTITIANAAPVVTSSSFGAGDEGAPVPFAVAFVDAGTLDTHTITWDFGDSTTGTGAVPTHVYADDGSYTVTVTVTDDDGGVTTASGTATVGNLPPEITATETPNGDEGEELSFSVSYVDPGTGDTHTVAWDFGDGSPAVSGPDADVAHTYEDDGAYTLVVTVQDDDGGSDTASLTVVIGNADPLITAVSVPATGDEGSAVALSATATDVSTDPLTFTWDFGDGSPAATGDSLTHSWDDDGLYTVTITVTDDDGGTDSSTGQITIANVAPSIDSMTAPDGDEGQGLLLSATASDPGADTLTFSWDFGDGSPAQSGATPTHAFPDDGVYTVSLTVTDDDGGQASQTATTTIGNLPPTITALAGPGAGSEGEALTFDVAFTDPGADTFAYAWDFGDGSPVVAGGASEGHTFDDDGAYTVSVTVTDDDGGSDSATHVVTISNVDPTIMAMTLPSGEEGTALELSALATDPSADVLTYEWAFGDGSPVEPGDTLDHTWTDDGSYTVTLTVTDDDGGQATTTGTAVVTNVDPFVTSMTGPATGDEGSDLTFEATGDDAGTGDLPDLTFTWDFDDGEPAAIGGAVDHAFGDEGSYLVTVVVDDGDGGTGTDTITIDINNVAPEITSSAPEYASEAALWSYQAVAIDPGEDVLSWTLGTDAPDGLTLDASSGLLEWTPSFEQSLGGPYAMTLSVEDGDGGLDSQTFTVQVGWTDSDGDEMADEWELDAGLDPTDPTDAAGDLDGDGVSNLDEFLEGTDPNVFDGPTAPVAVAPIADEEVTSSTPDLVVENATDPQLDALTYDFEVYEDEAMTVFVTSAAGAAPEGDDETTWKVDVPLVENSQYWWRAAASDGAAWGPWSALESFIVNETNEPPPVPVPLYPIEGETVASVDVELSWSSPDDVEGDAIVFDVILWDEALGTVITEAFGVATDARDVTASWLLDVELDEDTYYFWQVRGVDELGLAGDWSVEQLLFYSTDNAAPQGVAFVDPLHDDVVDTVSPELFATEGFDAEGSELSYTFEVDSVSTFDSEDLVTADLPGTGLGEVSWDLSVDGVELPENVTVHARVRGVDPEGVGSPWDVISFFVAGDNEPPPVPTLLTPADGAELQEVAPIFVLGSVEDPEGDLVFFDFIVARDVEMTDVVASTTDIFTGSGELGTATETSWRVDLDLEGQLYWSARAVDELGAPSEWAEPFAFVVLSQEEPPPGDDDDTAGACDCESSVGGRSSGVMPLMLLAGLLGLATRRVVGGGPRAARG